MHATIRRYESVDRDREIELTKKVNESLMPRLSKLPGFSGYYLIEAQDGVMTSINLFDTSANAESRLASPPTGFARRSSRRRFRIRPRSQWARSSPSRRTAFTPNPLA